MHHPNLTLLGRLSARAMLLGLLLTPLAAPQAQAAPDQVHPGRDAQTRNQPAPARPALKRDATDQSQTRDYSDRAFLSSMLAHHEGTVAMADQLLRSAPGSVNPRLARWAQKIRKNQTQEMMDLQILLDTAGGLDRAAYQEMARQMTDMMKRGQGLDPNVRFVVLMIPHHAGAVEMSLPALLYSDSRRIANLAQDIIEAQSKEIAEFRDWLSQQHHTL
ncbi:MAG: DUF305 domain-containing protein [Desulfovibrionaceae bacterium]|nr:DUF305 domain-containing protein [Desulfovibrionaceae bacterium]